MQSGDLLVFLTKIDGDCSVAPLEYFTDFRQESLGAMQKRKIMIGSPIGWDFGE